MSLLDLPVPLLLDQLLPLLSNAELANLARVSKKARWLTQDQVVWKRKTVSDFNFPAHATARVGGWKNLYRGLSDPHVYIWGEAANGRLGMQYEELPANVRRDVDMAGGMPYPYKIPTTGGALTRATPVQERDGVLVEIVAGGWSFHARTSTGRVWFWGTMNPETFAPLEGSHISPNDAILTPELLESLPPVQALASGRSHTVALTESGQVLEWRAWGLVWNIEMDVIKAKAAVVRQLEAGWSFSAVLTDKGDTYIWYSDWSTDAWTRFRDDNTETPVLVQPLNVPLLALPVLPDGEIAKQVAAGEDFVISLSERGTLYRLDLHLPLAAAQDYRLVQQQRGLADGDVADSGFRAALHHLLMTRHLTHTAQWQPLSSFTQPQKLHSFQTKWLDGGSLGAITHISAHFKHFVAFLPIVGDDDERDDTIVLLGSASGEDPTIVPEIQARGVIKLSMGDYHYGALTQQGELLTWGQFSKGALGNWPRSDAVAEPEVSQGWSNLIPLPRIFGRGPTAPRIGHAAARAEVMPALPGSRAAQNRGVNNRPSANVPHPAAISFSPKESDDESLFAYDIAFAGWQSSALVMQIPSEE